MVLHSHECHLHLEAALSHLNLTQEIRNGLGRPATPALKEEIGGSGF